MLPVTQQCVPVCLSVQQMQKGPLTIKHDLQSGGAHTFKVIEPTAKVIAPDRSII